MVYNLVTLSKNKIEIQAANMTLTLASLHTLSFNWLKKIHAY